MATARDGSLRSHSRHVTVDGGEVLARLVGQNDENIRAVEERYPVSVVLRGTELTVQGPDEDVVDLVSSFLVELVDVARRGHRVTLPEVRLGMNALAEGEKAGLASLLEEVICVTARGKAVRPKTTGQKHYIDAIATNDIVFAIGPAGTGKTYLAVAIAVTALKAGRVNRVILVRPAVEAGESLGFLPGDLQEKVAPYLRPLYDAFYELLSPERFLRYVEKGVIEIAPLAYMRGRTLNDSFIILDEAQNTTPEQMKMFLTRLGFGSKAVVTGDVTQVDLPSGKESGLKVVQNVLGDIDGIHFVTLGHRDVVRHEIVQKIVQAYDRYEQQLRRPQ